MPKLKRHPKLSRHKASGLAYVTWQGRRHYMGAYGSKEATAGYARFLARLAEDTTEEEQPEIAPPSVGWVIVEELCAVYVESAEGYYSSKDGRLSPHFSKAKRRARILIDHFGSLPVNEFSAKRFKMIQAALVGLGYSRVGINERIAGIRRIFKWGESEDLVPVGMTHGLETVAGLAKGRTRAPELPPVLPVDDRTVEATLAFCPPVVADMVQFQRLTGARPGEVCAVRPCDVDRSGAVWTYRPASHKTEHHGKHRLIFIGPRAQAILRRYLLRGAERSSTARSLTTIESPLRREFCPFVRGCSTYSHLAKDTPSSARNAPNGHHCGHNDGTPQPNGQLTANILAARVCFTWCSCTRAREHWSR